MGFSIMAVPIYTPIKSMGYIDKCIYILEKKSRGGINLQERSKVDTMGKGRSLQ